ncbi:MAG: IclR family transcriptional regulator [Pseudooceanicola nanhaiensis]|uniref:IclR family transcriptional regulator n=1 Tax=Rhodobacterales TaxID=204455 RepID=UPI004059C7E7
MKDDTSLRGTQLISRTAAVLRAVPHGSANGRRLRDIARTTQLTEPTVRRILTALVHEKFVTRDDESKRYRLGPIAFELGIVSGYQEKFVDRCKGIVAHVAQVSGDTTNLVKRCGADAICLIESSGSYPVHVRLDEFGDRYPLGISTAGTVLLAAMEQDEVDEVLASEIYDKGPLTRDQIANRVIDAQAKGYVDISDVPIPGIRGIGVPIPSASGQPTFAVTVAALRDRLSDDRVPSVVRLLNAASVEIARELENL